MLKTINAYGSSFKLSEDGKSATCEQASILFDKENNKYNIRMVFDTDLIADLVISPMNAGFKINNGEVDFYTGMPKEGRVVSSFIPKCKVSGNLIVHGAVEDATGYGTFTHALQVKPQCVGRWNFASFHSDELSLLMYQFEMPHGYDYDVDIVNRGSIFYKNDILAVTTQNLAIGFDHEYDAFSGYKVPKHIEFFWEGKTKDGEDVHVKISVNPGPPQEVVDVLSELPFLLRKFVQTFITKPFCYERINDVVAEVTIGDKKFHVSGKLWHEMILMAEMS